MHLSPHSDPSSLILMGGGLPITLGFFLPAPPLRPEGSSSGGDADGGMGMWSGRMRREEEELEGVVGIGPGVGGAVEVAFGWLGGIGRTPAMQCKTTRHDWSNVSLNTLWY